MNENVLHGRVSDVPWPTSDERVEVPDTSLPGIEKAPPSSARLLKNAAKGDTTDRLAAGAAPAMQRLGESLLSAENTLYAKTHQLRDNRDAWVESARSTLRSSPLASLAVAMTLGALLARITR